MDMRVIPLNMSSFSGFVMIVGGIWLIFKEKIFIDRETKQVTEIEVPLIGKFKTNVPALALFILGFLLLIYPIANSSNITPETEVINIKGSLKSNLHPVQVYAVITDDLIREDRSFNLPVPVLKNVSSYKVIYYVNNTFFEDVADLESKSGGAIKLPNKEINLETKDNNKHVAKLNAVSDEF